MIMGTHAPRDALGRFPATERAVREHIHHLVLQGKSFNTRSHRQQELTRLQAFLTVPLLEATPDDLYDWRASLTVGPGTIAGYISHVREFYRWALMRGMIAADPTLQIPVPAQPQRLPRPIPAADLVKALEATNYVRPMLVLAAWCGLRAKEIAGLRAENVLLSDDPPHILIVSEATKGRRERNVPLSPFVVAELAKAQLPVRGPVFTDTDNRPLTPWSVSKMCNDHLRSVGSTSTLHTLRHFFATSAYAIGNDIRAVQELLGHAAVSSTAIYTKVNSARTAAIVNAMPAGDALSKPPEPMEAA